MKKRDLVLNLSNIFELNNPFGINCDQQVQRSIDQESLQFPKDLVVYVLKSGKKVSVNQQLREIVDKFGVVTHRSGQTRRGDAIQKEMEKETRKRLAANFTSQGAYLFLGKLAKQFEEQIHNVADPFAGSGRLLKAVQSSISKKLNLFASELFPESACATLISMSRLLAEGRAETVSVFLADAFDIENGEGKFDMVIMNPPFTRRHRFDEIYLQKLERRLQDYLPYINGQPGLHVYSLFLADQLLRDNGILIAILPAATFSSDYSRGVMEFLLQNYSLHDLYSMSDNTAFSDGSKIREIILVASKKPDPENSVRFHTLKKSPDGSLSVNQNPNVVAKMTLMGDWNWLRYFETPLHSLDFINEIPLQSISDLRLHLIRGLEMYGPEFFIVPNEEWVMKRETRMSVDLKSQKTKESISIPKDRLVKVFRKPSFYSNKISPKVSHWMISIPPEDPPRWLREYIASNSHKAEVAIRNFGDEWVGHVHRQLAAKDPFGYLFIVDKFGFKSVGTYIHFSEKAVSATKNFYILKADYMTSKIIAAWMASSMYMVIFLRTRRIIGRDLGRLQISDFKRERMFIDPKSVSEPYRSKIIEAFDEFRKLSLPPLPIQINEGWRKELDSYWIQFLSEELGISIDLKQVYSSLKHWL